MKNFMPQLWPHPTPGNHDFNKSGSGELNHSKTAKIFPNIMEIENFFLEVCLFFTFHIFLQQFDDVLW